MHVFIFFFFLYLEAQKRVIGVPGHHLVWRLHTKSLMRTCRIVQ